MTHPFRQPSADHQSAAGTSSLWENDLTLVLDAVAAATRPLSRADVAASSGITASTSSRLVETLLAADLLAEAPLANPAETVADPPSLTLSDRGPAGLGLEVNVDYLAVCVADLRGEPRYREVQLGDLRGSSAEDALDRLDALAGRAIDAAVQDGLRPVAATLAIPGLVDADSGRVRVAPNLGWRDVDALSILRGHEALAGLPLHIDNDANLATRAELATGLTADSFVHITGEVGIGAGIVLDRAVFRGAHGWSGEVGHLTVKPDGRPCSCGARGCLEQYAGQDVLVRDGLGEAIRGTSLGGARALTMLVEEAQLGRPRITEALAAAGSALGIAIAQIGNVLDVGQVLLGGIYGPLYPYLMPTISRELGERLIAAEWASIEVRPATLGPEAAVIGAALIGVDWVLAQPAAFV